MRTLALPEAIKHWSLIVLQTRLIKTGGRLVRHARRLESQLAEMLVLPRKEGRAVRDAGTDQPASPCTRVANLGSTENYDDYAVVQIKWAALRESRR